MIANLDISGAPRVGASLTAAVALAVGCLFLPAAAAGGSWRHDSVWDDGNAEFCAYEVPLIRNPPLLSVPNGTFSSIHALSLSFVDVFLSRRLHEILFQSHSVHFPHFELSLR